MNGVANGYDCGRTGYEPHVPVRHMPKKIFVYQGVSGTTPTFEIAMKEPMSSDEVINCVTTVIAEKLPAPRICVVPTKWRLREEGGIELGYVLAQMTSWVDDEDNYDDRYDPVGEFWHFHGPLCGYKEDMCLFCGVPSPGRSESHFLDQKKFRLQMLDHAVAAGDDHLVRCIRQAMTAAEKRNLCRSSKLYADMVERLATERQVNAKRSELVLLRSARM